MISPNFNLQEENQTGFARSQQKKHLTVRLAHHITRLQAICARRIRTCHWKYWSPWIGDGTPPVSESSLATVLVLAMLVVPQVLDVLALLSLVLLVLPVVVVVVVVVVAVVVVVVHPASVTSSATHISSIEPPALLCRARMTLPEHVLGASQAKVRGEASQTSDVTRQWLMGRWWCSGCATRFLASTRDICRRLAQVGKNLWWSAKKRNRALSFPCATPRIFANHKPANICNAHVIKRTARGVGAEAGKVAIHGGGIGQSLEGKK